MTPFAIRKLIVLLCFFCLLGCKNHQGIQTGDLIFVDDTSSDLTKAINDVTKKSGHANYTHVGVCEVLDGVVYIYHASTQKNVVKEPFDSFKADRKNSTLDVFRIQGLNTDRKENAIRKAKKFLGMPYDYGYIYGDSAIYCSELVYEMFKTDSIFKLNPMTFKNPKTGEFHPNWVSHYEKLGIPIPEGEPGCNPNDMSRNKRLKFISTLEIN